MSAKSAQSVPTARRNPNTAKKAAAPKPTRRIKPSSKSVPKKSRAHRAATKGTKQSQLIDLLRTAKGGTIEQMAALTGWQAHTVRGTISGVLRKRLGLNVQSVAGADSGPRVYRIQPAA